jgi:hypothetical protein
MTMRDMRRWGAFQRDAVLIAGYRGLALAGAVTAVVGGSVGALTAWLAGMSWLLAALVALACLFAFYTVGAFQVWDQADRRAQDAEAAAKSASMDQSVKFWEVNGGVVAGNDIKNFSNVPPAGSGTPGGRLIDVRSGGITNSLVTVEFGDGAPVALPGPLPSTPEERIRLHDQLLALADQVEAVMAPFGQSFSDFAVRIGVPFEEAAARQTEIRAKRSRVDDAATARYNAKCRSAVIQAYGHARSIGFTDPEMERFWRSSLGVAAKRMPACLLRIAAQIVGLTATWLPALSRHPVSWPDGRVPGPSHHVDAA